MISESPIAPVLRKTQYHNKPSLALSLIIIVSFTEKNRQDGGEAGKTAQAPKSYLSTFGLSRFHTPFSMADTFIPGLNDSASAIIHNMFSSHGPWWHPRWAAYRGTIQTRPPCRHVAGPTTCAWRSWCTYTKSPPNETTHRPARWTLRICASIDPSIDAHMPTDHRTGPCVVLVDGLSVNVHQLRHANVVHPATPCRHGDLAWIVPRYAAYLGCHQVHDVLRSCRRQ